MSGIVHNTTVLNPGGGDGVRVLPRHSLVFAGGRITELLPADAASSRVTAGEFDEVVRGDRHIVVPGFVNTHHHLYQSLTRGLPAAQQLRLFDWLRTLYERWRCLDAHAVRLAAQVSIAELLRHGCTTTSDHFYMLPPGSGVQVEAVLDAADTLGIRLHLCRGSMSLGRGAGGLPPDDCVERDADILADCLRVLDAYHDPRPYALRRIDLAPCSPFNVTRELMRDTRVLARERGVLRHTHLAETLEEEAFCRERYHCRPVQYLADLDWLGPDVYLAHAVWLDEAEIALLAQTDTAVSLCPTSNMRLGSGLPRVERLWAAGVRLGLGVDGSSSNDAGNFLAEMKQALLVARVQPTVSAASQSRRAPLFPVSEAFRLATVGGAGCLRRPELGHLDPGAAADFALFRADDLALAGAAVQDPLAAMVLCAPPPADRVYVAGRLAVCAGRVTALDETALGREFNDLVAARFR